MIRLHLASQSPRRRRLLEEARIPFNLVVVDVEESLPPGLEPEAAVRELAERKAQAGAARCSFGWVLGADTMVVRGGRAFGKPADRRDAREMLASLSGADHEVLTGIALVSAENGRVISECASTRVSMRPLSTQEICTYVDSGEADDKAGAYAIQERGGEFVAKLEGSWSNVVGLPVELLRSMLARAEQEA